MSDQIQNYHAWLVAKINAQIGKDLIAAEAYETQGEPELAKVRRKFSDELYITLSYVENWNPKSYEYDKQLSRTK
jgi:hypothetical protein